MNDEGVTSFYTAWGSMKTLLKKEFVVREGRKFRLTDEGRTLALELLARPE